MNSILSNLGPRYSRRNSTTPIILGFLLLIIAIAVATYFLTRDDDDDDKDKKDENEGETVPSIEDPTVTRTLIPDSSNSSESGTTETYEIGGGKTETYQIEYNNGISDEQLSKNVKVGITWSNKSGFDNVYKLDIEHYVTAPDSTISNTPNDTHTIYKYGNQGRTGNSPATDNAKFFTNFQGGLTHEFQGLEATDAKAYSFVGVHTIKIIATYAPPGSTSASGDKTIDLTDGTGVNSPEVTSDDLAATLELTAPDVRVFKPIQGNFSLGDAEIDNQLYYASTTISSQVIDIHKSINISENSSRSFLLMRASTDNSNEFYFKFSDTEYLGYDTNNNLSIDTEANKKIITLVSSSLDNTNGSNRYFRLSFGDDLYAIIDESGNGAVKTMVNIETESVYNTLDWKFSTDDRSGVKPTSSTVSTTGRPDEGTYYIQNVGSEKWAYVADGNKMIFNGTSKLSDNTYKFEVKHNTDTDDEIFLKSVSQGNYCEYWSYHNYTHCSTNENYKDKYKMRKLNSDTYFMEHVVNDVFKRCKPDTNNENEPIFSCKGQTGETGSLSEMFKFVKILT